MPQLSSGQTASLVLDPGQSYTISTTGLATVKGIYGAPATTTTLNSNFAVFGPYGVPAKLDIACTAGSASYTLDQYEGDVVRSKSNPLSTGIQTKPALNQRAFSRPGLPSMAPCLHHPLGPTPPNSPIGP